MIGDLKQVFKPSGKGHNEPRTIAKKVLCDSFAKSQHLLRLKFPSIQMHARALGVIIFLLVSSSVVLGQTDDSLAQRQSTKQEEVYEKVDVLASIEYKIWRQHLEAQLQEILDSAAVRGMGAGTYIVKVRFVVEKDGRITNVRAIDDPGYGLGRGAEKVLMTSPKWAPAKKKGKKVRSYYIQPIGFVIDEE